MYNNRIIVSKEARDYKKTVYEVCLLEKVKKIDGRVSMVIQAYPPDKRIRDLDNLIKISADALQYAGAIENDSQIDEILISRMGIKKGGEIWVKLLKM